MTNTFWFEAYVFQETFQGRNNCDTVREVKKKKGNKKGSARDSHFLTLCERLLYPSQLQVLLHSFCR